MRVLKQLNEQLGERQDLTDQQVAQAVGELVEASVPDELKADFLCALGQKGETVAEISAFARELRARGIVPPIDAETRAGTILDVCGTGGDRLNTFNISTTASFVCAAAGVAVAKHGNRAITRRKDRQRGCAGGVGAENRSAAGGSGAVAAGASVRIFLRAVLPAGFPEHCGLQRKLCAARGQRDDFDFLGPLLIRRAAGTQLVGVPSPDLCPMLAQALQALGLRRGMVVSGRVGEAWLDELSTMGENVIAEFYQERGFAASSLAHTDFPVQSAALADLAGGDRQANAAMIRALLRNEDRGPKRDAVLLNAGAGLFVAGKTPSVSEGWELADELLSSGRAAAKLEELIKA